MSTALLGGRCLWYQTGCHALELLQDAERSLIRPIADNLSEWEKKNRETIQHITGVAEDIAREVGPDLIRYGVTGQLPTTKPPAPEPEASGGSGWMWPLILGGGGLALYLWLKG